MNISSNSLFHFTSDINILSKILNDKLYGSYCKEVFRYKEEVLPLYIPKISLCDIPLKALSNFPSYGKFGIGFNKAWGIKNRLNPVLYLEKDSFLTESLIRAIKGSFSTIGIMTGFLKQVDAQIEYLNNDKTLNEEKKKEQLENLNQNRAHIVNTVDSLGFNIYSLYYTKHYEDDLERGNKTISNYRFYDEREWCYVPDVICAVCELKLEEKDYKVWRGTGPTKPILPKVALNYSYDDIQHIIVEKESDVTTAISIIENIDKDKITEEQRKLLYSKINSFERLEKDY